MKNKLIFILCISLAETVCAQSLSPASIGQSNNIALDANHKPLSYGVTHLSAGAADNAPATPDSAIVTEEDYNLNIYPSPASNILSVSLHFNTEGMAYCLVYDSWGKKITDFSSQIDANGTKTKRLDISALPTGNYLLSMMFTSAKGGNETLTKRFEVVH